MKIKERKARQVSFTQGDASYGKWQFYFKLSESGNFASLNRTAKFATRVDDREDGLYS